MKKHIISLESIEFQDKTRAYDLQILLSKLRNSPYNSKQSQTSKELKDIEDFILRRFGLNISLITDSPIAAAAATPKFSPTHIFDFKEFSNTTDFFKNYEKYGSSIISRKESTISGYFSSIKNYIFINWAIILKNSYLSDEELTAIVLHELGHIYTTFEYCFRTVRTNQALSSLSDSIINNKTQDYLINLRYIGKEFFNEESKFDNLKELNNPQVIISYIISSIVKEYKTETKTPFYDFTTSEYLADQFVARHQYGVYLATALNKLTFDKKSMFSSVISFTIQVLAILGFGVLMTAGITLNIAAIFLMTIIVSNSFLTLKDFTYDQLKVRYKRISEQMIQDLKQQKYSNEVLREKIKEIEVIQKLIDNTYQFRGIFERLITFMVPSQRNANTAMKLQRDLEELASNNLFIQSAKFKLLQS